MVRRALQRPTPSVPPHAGIPPGPATQLPRMLLQLLRQLLRRVPCQLHVRQLLLLRRVSCQLHVRQLLRQLLGTHLAAIAPQRLGTHLGTHLAWEAAHAGVLV